MKLYHHEIIPALHFFGPLSAEEIREKLELRGHKPSTAEVNQSIYLMVGCGLVEACIGFSEKKYKTTKKALKF